jgi:hypothetical protein
VTEIRSYARVWDLERRIYRIEGLRLNPGGIPVRGVCYLIAAAIGVVLARHAPLLGGLLGDVPWYALDVAFPVALATLLGAISIEGRPFHLAAVGLLRFRASRIARPRQEGRAWSPQDVHVLIDGGEHRLRAVRYDGPGAVAIAVPHEISERRPRIPVRGVRLLVELTAAGAARARPQRQLVWLAPGVRLRVSAGERPSRTL